MPRLEDGHIMPQSKFKFKKRRAWIQSEEILSIDDSVNLNASDDSAIKQEQNKTITRVEHDYNKSITRKEHEYNKSETRPEQKLSDSYEPEKPIQARLKQDSNKSKTRIQQEYNKTKIRVKQECNKDLPSDLNQLVSFAAHQRTVLDNFSLSDPRYLILSLGDVQRKIFWHTALYCIKRTSPRTGPIEIKSFFDVLDSSTPVVRTSLNRLVEKGLLQRERGKLGKNGFAIISLPKMIFDTVECLVQEYHSGTFIFENKLDVI